MTCAVEGEKACISSNESLTLGVEMELIREMESFQTHHARFLPNCPALKLCV